MNPQDDPVFQAEYDAATSGAAIVPLAGWSTLRIAGRDRVTFLHNMCTNDIRGIAVGGQCEAFLTDVKGKIVGHALVLATEDELVLVGVPGQAERLVGHLDRYIIREDVRLEDATSNSAWGLLVGPTAQRAAESGLPGSPLKPVLFYAPCVQVWTGGFWVGEIGNARAKPQAAGGVVWESLRVESGWPLFGVDFDNSNLPQEVGRNSQAISFRKGCYLGQETIARIDALGHVNKGLATVKLSHEAAVGDELIDADGKPAGRLTSMAWSPKVGAWLALAMARRGVNEPGVQLTCGGHSAAVIATPAVAHVAPGDSPGAK